MISPGSRLVDLCKERGITLKSACASVDVKYGTIHRAIKEKRDLPYLTIDAFSDFFEVPVAYFSPRRAGVAISNSPQFETDDDLAKNAVNSLRESDLMSIEAGLQISTDMVLDWLDREKGVLKNFEAIRDSVDLFHPAKVGDKMIRAARIGPRSLASIFFQLENEEDYHNKVSKFDHATLSEMVATHVAVQAASAYRVDDVEISAQILGQKVAGKYRRIVAPVRDESGPVFTLVFARLIQAFQPQLHVQTSADLQL